MVVVQKRKIQWAISLFLVMLYFSCSTAQAQYGGGTGEPNDPYLIYTAEEMNTIGLHEEDWDKHFKLMADIDLSGFTGTDFNIIGYAIAGRGGYSKPFTGVFDGNGHTISNFSYISTDRDNIGLFGCVGTWEKDAVIKDLGLIEPNIDAGTGFNVGSLVGDLRNGTIAGCYAEGGSVSGFLRVGGLVGSNGGTIVNCYVEGGSVSGDDKVGGLLRESIGGLVGHNWDTISNCYATGSVSGDSSVGGLVGWNGGGITNCTSSGSVSGNVDGVGGLVGENYDGTITACHSSANVSGGLSVGGLVGYNA